MRKLLLACLVLFSFYSISAQGIPKGLTASNGVFIGFYEYKPANYDSLPSTTYPMIIFLHGVAERGNGTTELARVAGPGIPGYIKKGKTMTFTWNGKTETFIVLTPQLSTAYGSWPDFYIDEMIKYAKQNLRVDANRIFLTGLSLGGGGVWHYASNLLVNAKQLAGIAPVCGTCSMVSAANIANANLPVWGFHAQNDTRVSISCATSAISSINANSPAIAPLLTIYPTGDHYIWDKAYDMTHTLQNPNLFEWMLAQNKSLPANRLPTARSGTANVTVSRTVGTVTLNATGSSDPDGSLVWYVWTKLTGPSGDHITTSSSTTGITTITGLTNAGTYQYQLKAVDNRAGWGTTTVTVVVTGSVTPPPPPPTVPVAKAGADFTITLPTNAATLDGSTSTSPNGSIASYSWTKIGGPTQYTIASPAAAKTAISNLVAGVYSFRLSITDNVGAKDDDTVLVTVNNATGTNKPPVARAGKDTLLTWPANTAVLDGRWSSDDKKVAWFRWSKASGPAQYHITDTTASKTTVTNLAAGIYLFRLRVSDSAGAIDDDTMMVTVKDPGVIVNKPPVARAGSDITITLPITSTTLDGKWSSDPEKALASFSWSKVAGPAQFNIAAPNVPTTAVTNLTAGTYRFKLLVVDGQGLQDDDTVAVTVNALPAAGAINAERPIEQLRAYQQIAVYPNPANSQVTLTLSDLPAGNISIRLLDVHGRILMTISDRVFGRVYAKTLDISMAKHGLLMMEVITENGRRFTTKLLKQ